MLSVKPIKVHLFFCLVDSLPIYLTKSWHIKLTAQIKYFCLRVFGVLRKLVKLLDSLTGVCRVLALQQMLAQLLHVCQLI
jgi:hypothetical protein